MLTIEGLIAVISLCVTCFGLGYAIGSKDNDKTQKQPPQSGKLSGYLSDCFRANRLSAVPKGRLLQADALFSIGIVTYAVLICNMKSNNIGNFVLQQYYSRRPTKALKIKLKSDFTICLLIKLSGV